ncbi:MAG: pilus assembly protein [Candidatus Nealsonbacteria bacterium]|nr:pilus assembly protein [Candidatus Nealsonbacteria bacterium]
MGRAVLQACLPWLALLLASFAVGYLLVRLNRSPIRLGRIRELHRDQGGSVQSLSFVLTLPIFVMVMLFIVQVSQLMIATIVVHYSAFATARSAAVWIPANVDSQELENCISWYYADPDAPDQVAPVFNPEDPNYGPAEGGMTFVVEPGSPKYDKIASAAVMACTPISPSRDLGLDLPGEGSAAAAILKSVYLAMVPGAERNARIPARLENKLAYAMQNTDVQIRFYHKNSEPPLVTYFRYRDIGEFYFNEMGWQDQITVTVKHRLALLPGPGRFLASRIAGRPDEVSEQIERDEGVYKIELEASATIGNEGQKSVIPYVYSAY